jgi:hypothetical protein
MNTTSQFQLTAADLKKLEPYLKNDPNNICLGIPDVIIEECSEFLDILSEIRMYVQPAHAQVVHAAFVKKVFEKALFMILNKPIVHFDAKIIDTGLEALWMAYDDLESSGRDDIEDEVRESITDWDNGMIACAIIKACGNAAMLQPA